VLCRSNRPDRRLVSDDVTEHVLRDDHIESGRRLINFMAIASTSMPEPDIWKSPATSLTTERHRQDDDESTLPADTGHRDRPRASLKRRATLPTSCSR